MVKKPTANAGNKRCKVDPIPWRRKWHPAAALLLGKAHRRRSFTGHSSWAHKASDTAEHTRPVEKQIHTPHKSYTLLSIAVDVFWPSQD